MKYNEKNSLEKKLNFMEINGIGAEEVLLTGSLISTGYLFYDIQKRNNLIEELK